MGSPPRSQRYNNLRHPLWTQLEDPVDQKVRRKMQYIVAVSIRAIKTTISPTVSRTTLPVTACAPSIWNEYSFTNEYICWVVIVLFLVHSKRLEISNLMKLNIWQFADSDFSTVSADWGFSNNRRILHFGRRYQFFTFFMSPRELTFVHSNLTHIFQRRPPAQPRNVSALVHSFVRLLYESFLDIFSGSTSMHQHAARCDVRIDKGHVLWD